MDLYKIDKEFIKKCNEIDEKVMDKDRPYVGVVLEVNNFHYFAPLTSAKYSKSKANPQTVVKLIDNNNFYGMIRLNNMLPCDDSLVTRININQMKEIDIKYYHLIKSQYKLINYNPKIKSRIIKKAYKLYDLKNNKPDDYVAHLCCEYKALEKLVTSLQKANN